jgi:hypothetical protein
LFVFAVFPEEDIVTMQQTFFFEYSIKMQKSSGSKKRNEGQVVPGS